ncbi:MAG: hypothetical protein KAR79_02390, partial [Simkaniaceae bacterium]|nr:hypothetical protein [Simkaniaceae bacterium]
KFDYDVFSEMQQFFLATPEAFKGMRDCRYMTRIVCTLYRFQKILTELVENESKARHLIVKFYKTRLQLPFGVKPVLGIFIGLNFLRENEVFAKKHIIKAIHTVIPSALSIDDGYFVSKNEDKAIHTLYLEIEKENGKKFTPMELLLLRQELSGNLKGRIEHLLRPIFMPRNEEEVMRNMITLSQQLKYVRDLPQVIISFDEQTDVDLSFTIILVRVLLENALPIKDLFQSKGSLLQFFPDRKKNIGMIRKKYPKEASVFQVKLSNNTFLREDQSLDLYQARQFVLTELQRVFGEVRDYNGGMLSKQNEIYHALLQLLGNLGIKHSFLLENFFHSIFPVEHRSVLPPKYLQKLFLMLLDLQVQKTISEEGAWRKLAFFEHRLFTVMIFQDLELKQKLIEEVSRLQLHSSELISLHLQESERSFLGYIFLGDDQKKQTALLQIIEGSSD